MQRSSISPPLNASDLEVRPTFNVVIVYEDFETGKHGKNTYDYLLEHLGPDCQFNNQMWKFDVLSIPKLREMAAHDAAHADIILISSHGGDGLPAEVRAWIELWLSGKTQALALVALFDCPPRQAYLAAPIREYLAKVAKRGKMEFFAQPDDWPGKQQREETIEFERRRERSSRTLTGLAGAVQQDLSFARWGINE